jgi:hypothetical protein
MNPEPVVGLPPAAATGEGFAVSNQLRVFVAYLLGGAGMGLALVSWLPLWTVEASHGHFTGIHQVIRQGNLWEFLQDFPKAVQNCMSAPTPETFFDMLPAVHLKENVLTTVVFLGLGALAGLTAFLFKYDHQLWDTGDIRKLFW